MPEDDVQADNNTPHFFDIHAQQCMKQWTHNERIKMPRTRVFSFREWIINRNFLRDNK